MVATKDAFFKPKKMSAQEKAEQTDATARDILAAEAQAREKKTETLRALRMAQPVQIQPAKAQTSKTRKATPHHS